MALRARWLSSLVAMAALVGGLVFADRPAQARATSPIAIRTASLTQDGQQLVWHVQLARPFAPGYLERAGRSLCLAIERANGSTEALVCVGSARQGRSAGLFYMPMDAAGPAPARAVAATLSRSGSTDLTASFLPSAIGRGYASIRWQVVSAVDSPPCSVECTTSFPARPAVPGLPARSPQRCRGRVRPT